MFDNSWALVKDLELFWFCSLRYLFLFNLTTFKLQEIKCVAQLWTVIKSDSFLLNLKSPLSWTILLETYNICYILDCYFYSGLKCYIKTLQNMIWWNNIFFRMRGVMVFVIPCRLNKTISISITLCSLFVLSSRSDTDDIRTGMQCLYF